MPKYQKVPTTDNNGSTSTGSNLYGNLPSDQFSKTVSFVDPEAWYKRDDFNIPSPYAGDDLNPEYCKTLEGGNMLSDFDGLGNTQVLVGLGEENYAANACWKYKDGYSNLQWYMPAIGELGVLGARFSKVNNTIDQLGGLKLSYTRVLWSSTDHTDFAANYMSSGYHINYSQKFFDCLVRPFSILV